MFTDFTTYRLRCFKKGNKLMSNLTKKYKRHMRAYKILKILVLPFFRWWFNIDSQPAPDVEGPCLILANHNADLDPAIIHLSFKELLYFVASEHIFRAGILSRLLIRYFDPIPRLKGTLAINTVREVIRRIKLGMKVCIFAEGNRSFNGLTNPITPSTGRLAKSCGAPLITYKFEGGYFTTPRWAYTMRRGKMRGYVVNVYPPEQLKNMTVEEINAAIATDLYEDAYARQVTDKVLYKGKRLAEGLENSLFICPDCERFGTLKSKGNKFYCDCGLKTTYDELGYFNSSRYSTVTEWDKWQNEKLTHLAKNLGDELAFEDNDVSLVLVRPKHQSEILYTGRIVIYRDRIQCGKYSFYINNIPDMAIYGRSNITFTYGDNHYEIISKHLFCGRKYLELYKQLKKIKR